MLNLSGFFAHDSSVDCIASHGELVATAARDEVRIWEWRPCGELHIHFMYPILIVLSSSLEASNSSPGTS